MHPSKFRQARWGRKRILGKFNSLRKGVLRRVYRRIIAPTVHRLFFRDLIEHTGNFAEMTWLGQPIWQNVLDLWTIQQTIAEIRPELLIECGTNRGGSAFFYAQLFDLLEKGHVITVDVERMHSITHPRITFLLGSSVSSSILTEIRSVVAQTSGPIMVILDSDHSEDHVSKELESYANFVTKGSYLLVQDGIIDLLPMLRSARPGPLPAIRSFLNRHNEFEVDHERNGRFLITHHPMGWLRRKF